MKCTGYMGFGSKGQIVFNVQFPLESLAALVTVDVQVLKNLWIVQRVWFFPHKMMTTPCGLLIIGLCLA